MFPLTAPALALRAPLDTLSPAALAGLGVLIVVAVTLLVTGLIAWTRTPDGEMPPPNRWVWLALLFIQVVGPITFLIMRRRAAADAHARQELAATEASRAPSPGTSPAAPTSVSVRPSTPESAADLLYGERDG